MNYLNIRLLAVTTISALLLAACGGGGSSSAGSPSTTTQPSVTSSPPPVTTLVAPTNVISGVFDGKNDSGQPVTAMLQNDGSYLIVYSGATAPQTVLGAIVGTGTLTNGSFSSSNGLDLNLVGNVTQTPQAVTLSASYTQQQSLNGSLSYTSSGKTATFTSVYNNSYTTLPSMATLAGAYTGSIATKDLNEGNVALTIAQDGTVTGQLSCGCKINGTLAPRTDGMAYVANLSMVGGDHILSNKTFAGNVYLDTVQKRLYIVGNIVGTTDTVVFVGAKS